MSKFSSLRRARPPWPQKALEAPSTEQPAVETGAPAADPVADPSPAAGERGGGRGMRLFAGLVAPKRLL